MSSAPHDTCSHSSAGSSDSAVITGCDARGLDERDPRCGLEIRAAAGGAEQVPVTLPWDSPAACVGTAWRFRRSQALDRRQPAPLGAAAKDLPWVSSVQGGFEGRWR